MGRSLEASVGPIDVEISADLVAHRNQRIAYADQWIVKYIQGRKSLEVEQQTLWAYFLKGLWDSRALPNSQATAVDDDLDNLGVERLY